MSKAQPPVQQPSQPDRTPITVTRLSGTIKVDGLTNEPGWSGIQPIPFFVLEPVYGASPSEKSELLLTYDSKYLYVAARFYYTDSATIIARTLVRDGWRGDDWFAFDVDSRNDKQNALRFALYPLGTHYDMAISNDAVELGSSTINTNYNMIWEGKCAITKEGWFMEMKIPFAALRFTPKGNQTLMNISATRQSYHNNEKQHFPVIPQEAINGDKKASLKQPFLFENLKPSKLLYITPSLSTGLTRANEWHQPTQHYRPVTDKLFKPSLDIKYSVSPTFIADVTANTDFSQAEVDDQQFNLSRFSLFFPEKRLFFQEQAGLFEFKLGSQSQLFYSRRIGLQEGHIIPIIGGARITGGAGKTDVGIMNLHTAGILLPDSTRVTSENFGVLRTRHKAWNESSYVGTMFTSRISTGHTKYAGGVDAVVRLKGDQYFLGAFATTGDPSSKASFLRSSRASLIWDRRKQDKLFYTVQYGYSGKSFEPAIGFVDRSNFHNLSAVLSYGEFAKQRKGWSRYKKIAWKNDAYWNAVNGRFESLVSDIGISATSFREHGFTAHLQFTHELLTDTLSFGTPLYVPAGRYSFVQGIFAYAAPQYTVVRLPLTVSWGSFYDGTRTSFSTGPSWTINKVFDIQSKYTLEYLQFLRRQVRSLVHLASLQVDWALNLHLSGQVRLQYNSAINKLLANGRARYHFSDGHDIYVLYNQTYFAQRQLHSTKLPVFEQQQLLVKYSYTFY